MARRELQLEPQNKSSASLGLAVGLLAVVLILIAVLFSPTGIFGAL